MAENPKLMVVGDQEKDAVGREIASIEHARDAAVARINLESDSVTRELGYLEFAIHLQFINLKNAALQNATAVHQSNTHLGASLLEFENLSSAATREFHLMNFSGTLQMINQRNASLQRFGKLKEATIEQFSTDWNVAMQQLNNTWNDALQAFGNVTAAANAGFTQLVNSGLQALQQSAHATNLATQQAIIAQHQAAGLARPGFRLGDHLITAGFAFLVLYKVQNVGQQVKNVGQEVKSLRNDVNNKFSLHEYVLNGFRSGCQKLFNPILPLVDACKERLLNTALKGLRSGWDAFCKMKLELAWDKALKIFSLENRLKSLPSNKR